MSNHLRAPLAAGIESLECAMANEARPACATLAATVREAHPTASCDPKLVLSNGDQVCAATTFLLALSLLLPARAHASYEIHGVIAYSQFLDSEATPTPACRFSLVADGSRYSLRMEQNAPSAYDYQAVVFTGEELYHLVSLESRVPGLLKKAPPNVRDINSACAFLSSGPILYNVIGHEAGPVWLALASGAYFSGLADTTGTIPGVLSFDASGLVSADSVRMQTANWSCTTLFPNLPERVIYYDHGGIPGKWTNSPPYDAGFTNAVYEAMGFKDWDGLFLPERSTLYVYYPRKGGRTSRELRLAARYDIALHSAHTLRDAAITPPAIPGHATLLDARFVTNAGLIPTTRVTNWPTMETVSQSAAYRLAYMHHQKQLAHERAHPRPPAFAKGVRSVTVALLCLPTFVVFILGWRSWRGKRSITLRSDFGQ